MRVHVCMYRPVMLLGDYFGIAALENVQQSGLSLAVQHVNVGRLCVSSH